MSIVLWRKCARDRDAGKVQVEGAHRVTHISSHHHSRAPASTSAGVIARTAYTGSGRSSEHVSVGTSTRYSRGRASPRRHNGPVFTCCLQQAAYHNIISFKFHFSDGSLTRYCLFRMLGAHLLTTPSFRRSDAHVNLPKTTAPFPPLYGLLRRI
jgi:hypothetical protein